MALAVREIDSFADMAPLEGDWNSILKTSGEDEIFLRLEWLRPCWETFGDKRELLILEVSEDDRTVGFAPLTISKKGRPVSLRWIEFIGAGPSDRCAVIAENGREDVHVAAWNHILRRKGWNGIELKDMRENGPTDRGLKSSFKDGQYAFGMAPYLRLSGSHQSYLKSLSRSTRQGLSRNWKHLSSDYEVEFIWDKDESKAELNFRTFVDLCTARWKGKRFNVLEMPGMVSFLGKAAKELSKTNNVVFTRLDAGGRPVAAQLGFEYRNRYLYYLSGFDPSFSDYSPGSLLMSKIIEECYRRGLEEVDMLRGSEEYKYRFKAVDRRQVHFRKTGKGVKSIIGKLQEPPLR
jgi:CelD/BcsL family acetyltransferase involved in cellulose biosynthesis